MVQREKWEKEVPAAGPEGEVQEGKRVQMVNEEKKGQRVTMESRVNVGTMESREFMGLQGRRERKEVLESEVV